MRPHEFVGQAHKAAVDGGMAEEQRGMNQKEQRAVLDAFNRGESNVLVATSIAEEGLDIAEVDVTSTSQLYPTRPRLIHPTPFLI